MGSISQDVGFFSYAQADPGIFTTVLFFNQAAGLWKYWDTGSGKYLPVTQLRVGDQKVSYSLGDEVLNGWIVLNGRSIDSVTGISQTQKLALQSIFGAGGNLPDVTALTGLNNVPPNGTFAGIANPDTQPVKGVIGGLTADLCNLATNTETLRNSTAALQTSIGQTLTQAEAVINSLNGSPADTKAQVKVFCGYP
jgi:hypothetical protein